MTDARDPVVDREEPDPPEAALASEAAAPGMDVPEADAIDQQLAVDAPVGGRRPVSVGEREADDADVLDQETEVPELDPGDEG